MSGTFHFNPDYEKPAPGLLAGTQNDGSGFLDAQKSAFLKQVYEKEAAPGAVVPRNRDDRAKGVLKLLLEREGMGGAGDKKTISNMGGAGGLGKSLPGALNRSLTPSGVNTGKMNALNKTPSNAAMRASNPRVVLHNWVAQEAIDAAERGDDAAVARVLDVLMRPYDDGDDHFADAPPTTMKDLCVT